MNLLLFLSTWMTIAATQQALHTPVTQQVLFANTFAALHDSLWKTASVDGTLIDGVCALYFAHPLRSARGRGQAGRQGGAKVSDASAHGHSETLRMFQ